MKNSAGSKGLSLILIVAGLVGFIGALALDFMGNKAAFRGPLLIIGVLVFFNSPVWRNIRAGILGEEILTEEEIGKADGIIVAADTNVPMDRFDGKKVVECQVSKGINKPEELLDII